MTEDVPTERLSGADNAWRQMARVTNLTDITAVLAFEDRVDYDELGDRLEERLLRFDRFRQRIGGRKRTVRRPRWEPTPGFDIETHLSHVALPEPQDQAAFERFVGGLMSRPLDERRPLWEAYLVEGVAEGNALVVRLNHSLADGFALLYVLLGLADDPAAIDLPVGSIPEPPGLEGTGAGDGAPADGSGDPDTGTEGAGSADDMASGPATGSVLGTAVSAVRTAWDLLTIPAETETSLRGELGTRKRAAWTGEMDLARVKAIGRAHDATVNDVMLAATAGAFRRLLDDRDELEPGMELRCTVPVNLKPLEERTESLGNYFGLIFVPLPVGTPDLDERIRTINRQVDEQTAGLEAYLVYLTFTLGGYLPDAGQDWLLRQFEDQATGVVTNVPGPTSAFEFAGAEVSDIMFWGPQANDQGLSLSIFSYDGDVRVTVSGDANLLPEPRRLADAFEREVAGLETD